MTLFTFLMAPKTSLLPTSDFYTLVIRYFGLGGDVIFLPPEVHELRFDYSRGNRMGNAGTTIP